MLVLLWAHGMEAMSGSLTFNDPKGFSIARAFTFSSVTFNTGSAAIRVFEIFLLRWLTGT
jgi:hypothetical protein